MSQTSSARVEEPIKMAYLGEGGDERRDPAKPCFGCGAVMNRERQEQLVVLVEAGQDISLDVFDFKQRLTRDGGGFSTFPRCGCRS